MDRTIRHSFLSSLAYGALYLTATASPGQAATAPVQTLQPATGWAISRIAANAPGAAPYCAMARKFSDNMILTFARNNKSEISVAVDFQRDVLSAGQTYFTVLKPGYSQDRAFNVRPVSAKALVIRMGTDQDFFDALTRSEHLAIDLDGEQYSFVMPEMESGLHDMKDCLTSTARVASANPSLPGESSQSGNTSSAAEAPTATTTQTRVESKNAVKADTPPQGSLPEGAPVPLAPVSSQSVSTVQPGSGDASPDKVTRIEDAPVAVKTAVNDIPPAAPPQTAAAAIQPPPDDDMRHAAAVPRSYMAFDHAPVVVSHEDAAAVSSPQLTVAEASPPSTPVMADAAAASPAETQRIAQLEHQNDALRARLARSMAQADTANVTADRLKESVEKSSNQLAMLKSENASLRTRLAAMEAKLSNAADQGQQATVLRTDNAGLMTRLNAAQGQLAAAEADNSTLKTQLASASRAATGAGDAGARVAMLEAENQRLAGELTQALMDPSGPATSAAVPMSAAKHEKVAAASMHDQPSHAAMPRKTRHHATAGDQAMATTMAKMRPASGGPSIFVHPVFQSRLNDAPERKAVGDEPVSAMLDRAGIRPDGDIALIPTANGQGSTWTVDGLAGSATRQTMSTPDDFAGNVQAYIDRTEKRCASKFVATPGMRLDNDGMTTQTYDITCANLKGDDLVASLLFVGRDGTFTAIAHAGKVDAMVQAMDTRDRLAASLKDSRVASR